MAKKLAVVISGAVSLGSYEAGVTYEVLEAVAQHNIANPDDKIEIDVITGASAGGMTATILAKALLCHGAAMRDPYNNPLYKAWVEEVKMLNSGKDDPVPGLLEVIDRKDHKYALLNGDALNRIAENILPDDISSCPKDCPLSDAHPAASRDEGGNPQVLVGLAMGNLNGFPLSLKLNQGVSSASTEQFSYSQYKDRFVLRMARPQADPTSVRLEEWEEYQGNTQDKRRWAARQGTMSTMSWSQLREITLSSGAFPFAFGTRQIERHSDQSPYPRGLYSSRDSDQKLAAFPNDSDPFAGKYVYTDGGVFENEPVGLAMALIESLYGGESAVNDPDRYFLFIAPGARKADNDPFRTIKMSSSEARPDHLSVAKALIAAIMGQSRFQEWIKESAQPKVLAITSKDNELLGDVFSAFAGFLEEKFRAYDYNIGRQTAQDRLLLLVSTGSSPIRDFKCLQPIWPPTERLKGSWVSGAPSPLQTWEDARKYFGQIASIPESSTGQREQIKELNILLASVEPESRERIRNQILERVQSLVGFAYENIPKSDSHQGLRGLFSNVKFWSKGAWALVRGSKAMERFASEQVDIWLKAKLPNL